MIIKYQTTLLKLFCLAIYERVRQVKHTWTDSIKMPKGGKRAPQAAVAVKGKRSTGPKRRKKGDGEFTGAKGAKVKNYQKFTRKGVEFILKTKVKRGNKEDETEEDLKKQEKSLINYMWIDELRSHLIENCQEHKQHDLEDGTPEGDANIEPRPGRLVATQKSEDITEKIITDIRNKFFVDNQGVIRTKAAFHKSKNKEKYSGSILLWPEEITAVMKQKFRMSGNLMEIEEFFEDFWEWYQPRLKEEEVKFRKELTEYVFLFDDMKLIQKSEDKFIMRLRDLREQKIEILQEVQEKVQDLLGGPIESISESIQALEESIPALKPDFDSKKIARVLSRQHDDEEEEEAEEPQVSIEPNDQ